jgi:hypothetical protein
MTAATESPVMRDAPTAGAGVALSIAWVLAMFSNLPIYVNTFVFPPLQALHWIVVLGGFSALALLGRESRFELRPLGFPLVLVGYACVCLLWYVGQGGGDPVVLRQRLLGLAVCGLTYLVFATSPRALLAARRALAVVVLLAVVVNVYDITHPYVLIPNDSEFATVGRAAGFFINPNQSGAALVLGFVLSVGAIPPGWRVAFMVAVAGGVTLTWSRAAMLGFALACFGLGLRGGPLTGRQLLRAFVIGGAIAWATWTVVASEVQERFNIDPSVVLDRVLWILDPSGRADFSQAERIHLLNRGLEQFFGSPVIGNGLGSTELWEERTSTHNIYVMLASDFGIAGLLVLPILVVAAMGSLPSRRREANVGGVFVMFWGLFSHNVLGEFYLLVGIALLAALARAPEREGCG